jgi:hypothetical protein
MNVSFKRVTTINFETFSRISTLETSFQHTKMLIKLVRGIILEINVRFGMKLYTYYIRIMINLISSCWKTESKLDGWVGVMGTIDLLESGSQVNVFVLPKGDLFEEESQFENQFVENT